MFNKLKIEEIKARAQEISKKLSIMDKFFIVFFGFIFVGLLIFEPAMSAYENVTANHPFTTGFIKFAILATFGESLAQRIAFGTYFPQNYGLLPKAIIWGFLGICITACFTIFSIGAPFILNKLGFLWGSAGLSAPFGIEKIATSLTISISLNIFFAPVLMLSHSLTDAHVAEHKGSIKCLLAKPNVVKYLLNTNWAMFWKFAIVRNILFFWIPMHTITFLLPENFRVLFAAILGACLGLILTFIKMKSQKQ